MRAKIMLLRKKLDAKLAERETLSTRAEELEAAVEAASEIDPELETQVEEVATAMTTVDEEIATLTEAIAEQETAVADALETAIDTDPNDVSDGVGDMINSIRAGSRKRSGDAGRATRAQQLVRTGRVRYADPIRMVRSAITTSSNGITGPTGVGGINPAADGGISSIVDLVRVEDCTGMSSYKSVYAIEPGEAGELTEGTAPTDSPATFGVVELTPKNYGLINYMSREIAKRSPLAYEEAVRGLSRTSLRTRLNKLIVDSIVGSTINETITLTGASGAALFDATLLSRIILSYGGDESVGGNAVLLLTKDDLRAFAAVRGTNEYLPVYSIIPDQDNPNTGVIQDNNGLPCRYCLTSDVTSLSTASLTTTAKKTMLYGDPRNCTLGLWGDYDVVVDPSYKLGEGLLTIRGDITAAAGVTAYHGFVAVTAKSAS